MIFFDGVPAKFSQVGLNWSFQESHYRLIPCRASNTGF